jgi:hypothetical protein
MRIPCRGEKTAGAQDRSASVGQAQAGGLGRGHPLFYESPFSEPGPEAPDGLHCARAHTTPCNSPPPGTHAAHFLRKPAQINPIIHRA